MKNLKKLFLVPVLALGTMTSCYGGSKDDTKCPEVKECEKCPETGTTDSSVSSPLRVTYENGDEVSSELQLLYDTNEVTAKYSQKKLRATTSVKNGKVTFKSTNEKVATVTSSGLITALKVDAYCQIIVSDGTNSRTFDLYTRNMIDFFGITNGNTVTRMLDQEVEDVVLPEGYQIVNYLFFNYLKRCKKLTIPEGYTSIQNESSAAPTVCLKVEDLYLPTTLADFLIKNAMPKLKNVVIAEGNENLMLYNNQLLFTLTAGYLTLVKMFNGFDGNFTEEFVNEIISATGRDTYTSINIGTFSAVGLESVKNLKLPNNVIFPDNSAFVGSGIETVSIPRSSTINERFFRKNLMNCKNFREFKFLDEEDSGESSSFSISDGNLLSADGQTLYVGTNQGIIPESVTSISPFAFCGREFVNPKLKIPSNVTTIQQEVFTNTNLEKVWLPAGTSITSSNKVFKNIENYNNTYNSATYFCRGNDLCELVLDYEARNYTGSILGAFALSNPELVVYDENSADRGSSKPQWLVQARKTFLFGYEYNVSEEEFDAL